MPDVKNNGNWISTRSLSVL